MSTEKLPIVRVTLPAGLPRPASSLRWAEGYQLGQLRAAEFLDAILDEEFHGGEEELRRGLRELAAELREPFKPLAFGGS